jgi:hypothetical protein
MKAVTRTLKGVSELQRVGDVDFVAFDVEAVKV